MLGGLGGRRKVSPDRAEQEYEPMTDKHESAPTRHPKKDKTRNDEAEKLKHGETPKDETGAPKGKNRSNAGEDTS